jgi:hypothetical protein
MGLHPLQDYKERRCQEQRKNMEELVSFLQESTGAVHPLLNFAVHFDLAITRQRLTKSTGSTATLQIHGRCNTNHKSNQNRSTMGLFLFASHSPLLQRQVEVITSMAFLLELPSCRFLPLSMLCCC